MSDRCPVCGTRARADDRTCERCGRLLPGGVVPPAPLAPPAASATTASPVMPAPVVRPLSRPARGVTAVSTAPGSVAPAPPLAHDWLAGTVVTAEAVYEEPPDTRVARNMFLVVYNLPVIGLVVAGAVMLALLFVPLRLLGLHGPGLLSMLTLLGLARRQQGGSRMVPVRNWRLRQDDGAEIQVRLKGHLRGGGLERGDRCQLRGRWRDGLLHVHDGMNLRTRSRLRPRDDVPWRWIVPATAFWLFVVIVWLHEPR